jgi:phenylacetate-CoA ligase
MPLASLLSRHVFHPLWDLKDRSWRLRTLRELRRSQWLPLEAMRQRQLERLRVAVRHAGATCPYYQRMFAEQGFNPSNFELSDFARLPVLTKADIRAKTPELLSKEYAPETLGFHKTGGSTGVSLTTYFDVRWQEVRTADAMRANEWANWYHGMKAAAVWGNPPQASTWKERLRSALFDRLIYLDTMNLNAQTLADFVTRWRAEKPEILFGHSHSLYMLGKYLVESGIRDLRPRGIVSTSMMLIQSEREVIERAFGVSVTDRYGCEEVGLIASECEQHRGFHLNIEHLFIEFLRPDGTPAEPGEEGAIVVTDLLNRAMPLIRYRIEDVGVPSTRNCPCGRGMPMMERVAGRVADYLKKPDGSMVAGVSLVERTLTAISGIEQMQIVQTTAREIVLNIVRAPDHSPKSDTELLAEFRQVFGDDVDIRITYVDKIPQEASGKYRFSICRI